MHYLFLLSLLLLSSMVHARPCEQAKPLLLKANDFMHQKQYQAIPSSIIPNPSLKIRLSVSGKGKTQLSMPGKSEADHLINRRVKVKLSFL